MPRKASRSASRGRTSSPKKTPKKTPKKSPATKSRAKTPVKTPKNAPKTPKSALKTPSVKMDFDEGSAVMARWPGTSLYFKAKVTFVRDDDNEYDVEYEDGTVFTIKAKDVKSRTAMQDSRKSRSQSRGRSPARKTRGTPKSASKATPKSASRSSVRAPRPDPTPVRSSARLASAKIELSSDEEDGPKAIPNPSHPRRAKRSWFPSFDLEWLKVLILMFGSPLFLLSMFELCSKHSCQLKWPVLNRNIWHYWNKEAFGATVGFLVVVRLLSLLPIGRKVRTASGNETRLNGFFTLVALMAIVPAMFYRKMSFAFVDVHYFHLMTSAIMMSSFAAKVAFVFAKLWGKRSNVNAKGNTGNIIVDIYHGRELNPFYCMADLKLLAFRSAIIGLAVMNAFMVMHKFQTDGKVNPAVAITAAFQILGAFDMMFFEEYFFYGYDALHTGYGFFYIYNMMTFPFMATFITRYVIAKNPVLMPWQLVLMWVVFIGGYIIYRASENQRCEFVKNPHSASVRHLETISTVGGKKILCSGWWAFCRYPNHLGHLIGAWAWILPAVSTALRTDLLIYLMPVMTTMVLLFRCTEENARNKRRYGHAWDSYCQRVPANILPKVF